MSEREKRIAEGRALIDGWTTDGDDFFERALALRAVLVRLGESETARQFREVERRYADVLKAHDETGAPLPAPNGQPSRLDRRQWIQVRTPDFKNWFGDWERDENKPVAVTKVEKDPGAPSSDNAKIWRVYVLNTLRGKETKIADNGVNVEFFRNGLESSLKNRNRDARALYASLPEILRHAVYLGYEENTKKEAKPGAIGYEYYVAAVNLGGAVKEVSLALDLMRDEVRGRGYYYHQISDVEIGDPVGSTRTLEAPESPNHTLRLGDLRGFSKFTNVSQAIDPNGEPLVIEQGGRQVFRHTVTGETRAASVSVATEEG